MNGSKKKRQPPAGDVPAEGSGRRGKPDRAGGFLARRPMLRFVIGFGVLWGLFELFFFGLLLGSRPFEEYLAFNAELAGAIIRPFGQECRVTGQAMAGSGFVMQIRHGCDAIQPLGLFLATVLAFPAAMSAKIPGVLAGVVLLLSINMVRICSLFFTGIHYPRIFEMMHADVWQAIFIFLALLFWLLWAHWATRPRSPQSDAPA